MLYSQVITTFVLLKNTKEKNTMKVEMRNLKVGDVVQINYAFHTEFLPIAKIEHQFQLNGIKQIVLIHENGNTLKVAKETTKITKL